MLSNKISNLVNLTTGKDRKKLYLQKVILMKKINKLKKHTIFVKKDSGKEDRKREKNKKKRSNKETK